MEITINHYCKDFRSTLCGRGHLLPLWNFHRSTPINRETSRVPSKTRTELLPEQLAGLWLSTWFLHQKHHRKRKFLARLARVPYECRTSKRKQKEHDMLYLRPPIWLPGSFTSLDAALKRPMPAAQRVATCLLKLWVSLSVFLTQRHTILSVKATKRDNIISHGLSRPSASVYFRSSLAAVTSSDRSDWGPPVPWLAWTRAGGMRHNKPWRYSGVWLEWSIEHWTMEWTLKGGSKDSVLAPLEPC